jgi:hypothetical protein
MEDKYMKEDISKKNRLRDIIRSKIMPAIRAPRGSLVDCVRVRIESEDEDYLREAAIGRRMQNNSEYKMLQMSKEQLENCQLKFEEGRLVYKNNPNEIASTKNKESKGIKDLQAFVFDKDGSLYIATHTGLLSKNIEDPTLTHASFLRSRPAELTGMLSINEKGKITKISNNSGHYKPEILDMYRGIKLLKDKGVFADDCRVQIGRKSKVINSFMSEMESIQPSGQMLHEELREIRANDIRDTIIKVSSLGHQIDYLMSSHSNVDNTKIIELFESVVDSKDNVLMERFIEKINNTKKLQDFSDDYLNKFDETPMHHIAYFGTPKMAELLASKGVDLEVEDNMGNAPIYNAVLSGDVGMVKLLFEKGASLDNKDNMGKSLLHIAVSNGSNDVIKFLLERGADLNAKDHLGEVPIHNIASSNNLETAKILLEKGADLHARNLEGDTPLDYVNKNAKEMLAPLVKIEKDIEIRKFCLDQKEFKGVVNKLSKYTKGIETQGKAASYVCSKKVQIERGP